MVTLLLNYSLHYCKQILLCLTNLATAPNNSHQKFLSTDLIPGLYIWFVHLSVDGRLSEQGWVGTRSWAQLQLLIAPPLVLLPQGIGRGRFISSQEENSGVV